MTADIVQAFLPRGTVWPWVTCVDPPEGWMLLPSHVKYMTYRPTGIVATRDHNRAPRMPEDVLRRLEAKAP